MAGGGIAAAAAAGRGGDRREIGGGRGDGDLEGMAGLGEEKKKWVGGEERETGGRDQRSCLTQRSLKIRL